MSPSSSPCYAFVTDSLSKNDPYTLPSPLLHSNTHAAEHRSGYSSRMYEPSVTATSVSFAIACRIQSTPPLTVRLSHSHVLPHDLRTSMKVQGAWDDDAAGAVDNRCLWLSSIVRWTEPMTLSFVHACLHENLNLLGFRSAMYNIHPLYFCPSIHGGGKRCFCSRTTAIPCAIYRCLVRLALSLSC
jgi:hypothetical protein